MTFFWILWLLVAAITAVAVCFFVKGLRLASPKYYSSWAQLLGYLVITLTISPWLAQHGLSRVAWVLLALPSVLATGYLLMLGLLIVCPSSWR